MGQASFNAVMGIIGYGAAEYSNHLMTSQSQNVSIIKDASSSEFQGASTLGIDKTDVLTATAIGAASGFLLYQGGNPAVLLPTAMAAIATINRYYKTNTQQWTVVNNLESKKPDAALPPPALS